MDDDDLKASKLAPASRGFDVARVPGDPTDHRETADVQMPNLATTPPRHCPRCKTELIRRHRTSLDRAVNAVVLVHRYECPNRQCGWKGLLRVKRRKKGKRTLKILGNPLWAWALVIAGAILLAFILIEYLGSLHSLTPPAPKE